MDRKEIEKIFAPPAPHMVGDGFKMHNFIPGVSTLDMKRMDPFLVLDYGSKMYFSPADKPRGVGCHPHRGFETVTIAYHGSVAHEDSTGAGGIINEGDVQWMTAAKGILHKEFHSKEFTQKGGDFQMIQLWVNLPAAHKMSKPGYQTLKNNEIPKVEIENQGGIVEVISGEYKGIKGAARTYTSVNLLNTKLNQNGKVKFSFPANYNTALIVVEGSVMVNGEKIPGDYFVLFKNEGEEFIVEALENSVILTMSGEPIHEPIAAHGPFVMNTREELMEAFQDYNTGKFGYMEENLN